MFLIKKILEAFILPPGILVIVLAGLGVYFWKKERRAALVFAVLGALVWVGTAKVFCDMLIRPLENAYQTPEKPRGDVIVLLCGGFRGGGNPYSASERLAAGTLERADAAFKLYKDIRLPVLVSGGAPFSARPEAEAAAAYLLELGVPARDIVTEQASRDTWENAVFTMKICRELGFKRIILVTSAYHMPRSVRLFRKAGAEAPLAFPVARRAGGPRYLRDWLPGGSQDARLAVNELLGMAYYGLFFL